METITEFFIPLSLYIAQTHPIVLQIFSQCLPFLHHLQDTRMEMAAVTLHVLARTLFLLFLTPSVHRLYRVADFDGKHLRWDHRLSR